MTPRPRRSALYVPGANPRALAKAATLPADVLILDLEDAVLPEARVEARQNVLAALQADFGSREVVVRVNGLDTVWGAEDIATFARSPVAALLLPKVDGPDVVQQAATRLHAAGAPPGLALWAMAETPAGVLSIEAICAASPRLAVIVMGTNDLARALRMPPEAVNGGLVEARSRCVLAARARGLDILDGVCTVLDDAPGFSEICRQGRLLGFDGKTLIHPRQVQAANELFGVSAAQAAMAAETIAAWETAAREGRGVAVVRGQMIEQLHADEARRVLTLHAATTGTE